MVLYTFQKNNTIEAQYVIKGNCLRLLKYSAYATGVPSIVTMLTLVVEYLPEDYGGIRPRFGINSCFFETHLGNLLFFHILLIALEVANAILFIIVALKLHSSWKFSKQVGIRQYSIRNGTKTPTFKGISYIR